MKTFKAAVVQSAPMSPGASDAVEKVRLFAKQAKDAGSKLVVFPEAFIGGYPKGKDFGVRIGSRSIEGRKEFRRYFEAAIEVPGQITALLGEIAKEFEMYLVIGVIEREIATLYCCALFFSSDGSLLAKHRKLVPTAMERLIWGCGDG